jgi:hypothetical protein
LTDGDGGAVRVDELERTRRRHWPARAAATSLAVAAVVLGFLTPATAHPATAHPATARPTPNRAASAPPAAGTFRSVPAVRLLTDTAIPARGSISIIVTGHGVPTDASAVLLNLADRHGGLGGGYLTAWPTGAARPPTTNLNVPAGQWASNSAVVRVGTGGAVDLYNGSSGAANWDVDVSGYYVGGSVATTPGGFVPVPAARILDTRSGVGAPNGGVSPHGLLDLTVAGHGGVPTSGVSAVAITVAVLSPTAAGTLPVYAYGTTPTVSQLSFYPFSAVAGFIIVPLGSGGRLRLANQSAGLIGLTADVAGYFLSGTPTALGAYHPVDATRLFAQTVPKNGRVTISVSQRAGLNLFDVSAVALHVTAYHTFGTGSLSVGASDQPQPPPALIYDGRTSRNTVLTPLSASGGLTIVNSNNLPVDVLIDLAGTAIYPRPTWHAGAEIAPPYGNPRSVSCPTANFCAAVDNQGSARTFNGAKWSNPVLLDTDPTGPAIDDPNLSQVSCWAPRRCIAVSATGFTFELTSGGWTNLKLGFDQPHNAYPIALVCVSTTFCMLELQQGGVTIFDGHRWGSLALAGQVSGGESALSCASASFCVSVASGGDGVWRWNGVTWASGGTVDTTSAILTSVSCPTTTFCKIGESGDDTRTFDGTSLSTPQPGPSGGVEAITCTSATFCAAVPDPSYDRGVSTFDGTSWSATTMLVVDDSLPSLSCADASHCHAVSYGGDDFRYNGHTWSAGQSFDPSESAMTGLSCPTTTFCALAQQGGQIFTLTGTTWSGPTRLSADDTTQALSCASPTFCIAVASDGFYRWDGAAWHLEDVPGYADASTTSISCPSATFCLSVGKSTEVFNGTTWTAGTIPVTGVAVSCTSATFCAALVGTYCNDDEVTDCSAPGVAPSCCSFVSEQATTFNGATWTAPVSLKNFTWSQSISCGAPSYCVATGLIPDAAGDIGSRTYNAGAWGASAPMGPADAQEDLGLVASNVSCHGSGFCQASYLATQGSANAYTFNGARWDGGTPVAPRNLTLSCPSSTFCIGVGATGRAYTWS